jgi:hypothetical protein
MTDDFNMALCNLTAAIADATAAVVPVSRPCPYSKRWWTKELTTMKQQTRTLGRRSHQTANEHDPVHEAYRTKRNEYTNTIQQMKKEH